MLIREEEGFNLERAWLLETNGSEPTVSLRGVGVIGLCETREW